LTENQVAEGAVSQQGRADLELLYEGEDFTVNRQTWVGILPFEINLEKGTIKPEMVLKPKLSPEIEGYAVNDGRGLRAELTVSGRLELEVPTDVQVLTDITATGGDVEIRRN